MPKFPGGLSKSEKRRRQGRRIPGAESQLVLKTRIGSGGMGEVFEAIRTQPSAGFVKKVAVKRILPRYATDERMIERFLAEARLAANLNHPNIVEIYDIHFDHEASQPMIQMEFVNGQTLRDRLEPKRGMGAVPLPPEEATRIISCVLRALRYAHRFRDPISGELRRIIHADINPRNVMVTDEGEVKVLDFGIAKALQSEDETQTTQGFTGTPAYIAPEQALGIRPNEDTDLYSAGLLYFELLTGSRLFMDEKGGSLSPATASDDAISNRIDSALMVPEGLRGDLKSWLRRDPRERKIPTLSTQQAPQLPIMETKRQAVSYTRRAALIAATVIAAFGIHAWAKGSKPQAQPPAVPEPKTFPMTAPAVSGIEISLKGQTIGQIQVEDHEITKSRQVREFSMLACQELFHFLRDITSLILIPGKYQFFHVKETDQFQIPRDHLPSRYALMLSGAKSEISRMRGGCLRYYNLQYLITTLEAFDGLFKLNPRIVGITDPDFLRTTIQRSDIKAFGEDFLNRAYSTREFEEPQAFSEIDQELLKSILTESAKPLVPAKSGFSEAVDLVVSTPEGLLNEEGAMALLDYQVARNLRSQLLSESGLVFPRSYTSLFIPSDLSGMPLVSDKLGANGVYKLNLRMQDPDIKIALKQGICIAQRFGMALTSRSARCLKL